MTPTCVILTGDMTGVVPFERDEYVEGCGPYVVTFLTVAPTFEWSMPTTSLWLPMDTTKA